MISKKLLEADGSNKRFLSDFIIRSAQFARPYVYVYDNTLNPDGSEDVLQDIGSAWSFPDNLYKRGTNAPKSEDLVTVDKWQVVDNSILFFDTPLSGTSIWLEVATTSEEFGETLTAPSVERAEAAADNASASAVAAASSETAADASETASGISETNSAASEAAAGVSETNATASESSASTSASNASTSASNASDSETAAGISETNAAASETAAGLSETAAALSETNSATSESNAALSETNSAASEVAAAESAASINPSTLLYNTSTAQTKIGDLTIGEVVVVASWSYSGTTVTVNTSAIHNLSVGQYFRVSGLVATTNTPNGRWVVVAVVDIDTITFTAVDTPTGTPTVSSASIEHGDITLNGSFKEFDLGQTWQDVKASRALATVYTNNTGKPIMVSVGATRGGGNPQKLTIVVDGVTLGITRADTNTDVYVVSNFLVPKGSTYIATTEDGVGLDKWAELR